MVDKEKREQEAYERGYDIDESYGVSSAGKLPLYSNRKEHWTNCSQKPHASFGQASPQF